MKHSYSPVPSSRQTSHIATHAASMPFTDPHHRVTLEDIYQKLIEVLNEVARAKAGKKAIRLPDVKELTSTSRSQIYALMNPKCSAHDPSFPRPFHIGNSTRWWAHDVQAWLDAQASASQVAH